MLLSPATNPSMTPGEFVFRATSWQTNSVVPRAYFIADASWGHSMLLYQSAEGHLGAGSSG